MKNKEYIIDFPYRVLDFYVFGENENENIKCVELIFLNCIGICDFFFIFLVVVYSIFHKILSFTENNTLGGAHNYAFLQENRRHAYGTLRLYYRLAGHGRLKSPSAFS